MLLLLTFLTVSCLQEEKSEGTLIFNGTNYLGFKYAVGGTPENVFMVQDGCMVLNNRQGYVYTEKTWKNYILTLDYRYPAAAKGKAEVEFGTLLHISTKHLAWPDWPLCVEVNGKPSEAGKLSIHDMTRRDKKRIPRDKMLGEFTENESARSKSMKKIGEWNSFKMECKENAVTVWHNGEKVSSGTIEWQDYEGKKKELNPSVIAFFSKGYEVHLKNIRVKELP